MLIAHTNKIINTENRFICISRPRRFGKSMAAKMLTAYYSRGCDSAAMFAPFKIAHDASFEKHLNQYNVIRINMANFMSRGENMQQILDYLCKCVCRSDCHSCTGILPTLAGDCPRALTGRK